MLRNKEPICGPDDLTLGFNKKAPGWLLELMDGEMVFKEGD
jgi:hypothetical protein